VTCSDGTPSSLAPTPAFPPFSYITATCATNTAVVASLSPQCAPGEPVTLLILANDLYGNSIIPTPIPPTPAWPLPSTCNQSNTINYIDYSTTISNTPVAIGNWNICAFQSSSILTTTSFPSPNTYLTCPNAVGALSNSSALYSDTITVLPRTPPSVAW
jgi:hypothetical protein